MTISVKDASGTPQTVKTFDDFAGVAGAANANVLSVQGVTNGIAVRTLDVTGGSVEDAADVTLTAGIATLILASEANRAEALIVAHAGNTETIRIGSASVGANRGAPLVPGGSFATTSTGLLYGYAGTSGQKVSIVKTMNT